MHIMRTRTPPSTVPAPGDAAPAAPPADAAPAAPSAAAGLDAAATKLDDPAILKAAQEHQPLFRLSLRMRPGVSSKFERYEAVYFQEDGGRFSQEHTLKFMLQQEYRLQLEIDDLGRTLTNVISVVVDQNPLKIDERRVDFVEKTCNHSFVVGGAWTPTHESSTQKGQRDLVLIEVEYMHGSELQTMTFTLQCKVYPEGKLAKATKGKQLDVATCRYDASKGKGDERWTFAEARPA